MTVTVIAARPLKTHRDLQEGEGTEYLPGILSMPGSLYIISFDGHPERIVPVYRLRRLRSKKPKDVQVGFELKLA